MNWPSGGQWEAVIGEAVILPLLFFELYRLRRSQRRDREKARASAEANPAGDVAERDIVSVDRDGSPTPGTECSGRN